jgi:hypothetical protein
MRCYSAAAHIEKEKGRPTEAASFGRSGFHKACSHKSRLFGNRWPLQTTCKGGCFRRSSAAVATSREDHRKPRSGQAARHPLPVRVQQKKSPNLDRPQTRPSTSIKVSRGRRPLQVEPPRVSVDYWAEARPGSSRVWGLVRSPAHNRLSRTGLGGCPCVPGPCVYAPGSARAMGSEWAAADRGLAAGFAPAGLTQPERERGYGTASERR